MLNTTIPILSEMRINIFRCLLSDTLSHCHTQGRAERADRRPTSPSDRTPDHSRRRAHRTPHDASRAHDAWGGCVRAGPVGCVCAPSSWPLECGPICYLSLSNTH